VAIVVCVIALAALIALVLVVRRSTSLLQGSAAARPPGGIPEAATSEVGPPTAAVQPGAVGSGAADQPELAGSEAAVQPAEPAPPPFDSTYAAARTQAPDDHFADARVSSD